MAKLIQANMRGIYRFFGERFRRTRARRLAEQFSDCGSVLDVGGSPGFWRASSWHPAEITFLNIDPAPIGDPLWAGSRYVQGDGQDIQFPAKSFDLAMSNSVIEHVPDQAKFAAELRRVGKRLYCQTPSYWFPVEPHCLGLFVHWLPKRWFTHFVHRYFTLYGWMAKPDQAEHEEFKQEVHLLSKNDLKRIFPGCAIQTERFFGWPKSYVVTGVESSSDESGKDQATTGDQGQS